MAESDKLIRFPRGDDLSSLPDHLIPSIRVDTPELLEMRRRRAARRKQDDHFVLGPIPFRWVKACREAHPEALALALVIRGMAKMLSLIHI